MRPTARLLTTTLLAAVATSTSAQILDTEVWLGSVDMRDGRFNVSALTNISNHPGYDNQPAFFPDESRLVFTTEAENLSDTGLGVHAVLHEIATGRATPLQDARGFSPTPTADGRGLMLLREGGVWLHDLAGQLVRAVVGTKEAGYFTRFDERTWALFMNDKERRIVIYDAKTRSMDTMAVGAITAPYRVPGKRQVTFVAEVPFPLPERKLDHPPITPERHLRLLDMNRRRVTTLAKIPFPTGGHHVWTSRGTLLMASGPAIYEWSPRRPDSWTEVFRSAHADLQGITRIAISPSGRRIALVSTPRDETVIRNSRIMSNRAIARKDASAVADLHARDGVLTAGSGKIIFGREAIEEAFSSAFAATPDVIYERTPQKIALSSSHPLASEQGTWTGRWTTPQGPVSMHGDYMTMWRREMTSSGTPAWTIQSELFVTLDCKGSGCAGPPRS